MTNTLYVVGTPIGNLGDLSPRARLCLSSVDLVIAEDTRVFGRLCHLAGIIPKVVRSYQGKSHVTEAEFLHAIEQGDVALVSDAGMPGVSDPGADFVALTLEHGFAVSPVPGASVLSAALALWPRPVESACFYGFLPRRGNDRIHMLARVMQQPSVGVLLESPRRLVNTLRELADRDGSRMVLLLGELTKLHESIRFGSLDQSLTWFVGTEPKGEWAIIIDSAPGQHGVEPDVDRLLEALARSSLGTKEAAALYAQVQQSSARSAYAQLLARRSGGIPAS